MAKLILVLHLGLISGLLFATEISGRNVGSAAKPSGDYKLVIEGFDWGPAVSKVILSMGETVSSVKASDYVVFASRKSDRGEIAAESASGSRTVVYAYVSDENGARTESGNYLTLVLAVSPIQPIGSPIQYFRSIGNVWIDYKLTIVSAVSGRVWDAEVGRIMPLIDQFKLDGKFTHSESLTMSYASFTPKDVKEKTPLIIWLHGGGEGGTDPTIPLVGNRAANYASEEIQRFFDGGAYVLVPQCPGAWMHNGQGVTTHGKENDIYNEGLMALINNYVKSNPKIDKTRIYVGGCSNGGYMALKLILLHPDYFAAGFISSLAYQSEYISDQDIRKITKVPMWFVHAKDDPVTIADKTVVPVYNRLKAAGAKQVHFSFYDHVIDITGFYGGENYRYNGHWSWIYCHANLSMLDLDGSPVQVKGRPASIMEWLAAQRK